jgi:hypothetical protein
MRADANVTSVVCFREEMEQRQRRAPAVDGVEQRLSED